MAELASLVIKLSADVARLQGDLDRAVGITNRASTQMTSALQGAGSVIKEFAAGLAAAFTINKILEVGKASIDLGDNLNKMSQKVGVSVEALSALRNVGQLADASFEQLGAGMVKLARNAAEAASGGREQAEAFKAIGVSVKDANGNLRPTQSLLEDIAKKMAGFEDSASKTALATQLFGKSGAELLPVLNQLGTEGFDAVTQAARDYNQVIGTEQAKQSEQFNDNLSRLTMAASGFANAVVKELLPGLVAYSNEMAEAAKSNDQYTSSASFVSDAIKTLALAATIAKETLKGLGLIIIALGDTLGGVGDLFNGFAKAVISDLSSIGASMSGDFVGAKAAFDQGGKNLADGWESASSRIKNAWKAAAEGSNDAVARMESASDRLFGTFSNVSGAAETTAGAIKKTVAPIVEAGGAAKDTTKALEDLARAQKAWDDLLDTITGQMGPAEKAQSDFNKSMRQLKDTAEALAIKGGDVSVITEQRKAAEAKLTEQLEKKNAALEKSGDVLGNYLEDLKQSGALDLMTAREKAVAAGAAKITDEWKKNAEAGGKVKASLAATVAGYTAAVGAAYDLSKAFTDSQSVLDEFSNVTPFDRLKDAIAEVGEELKKATDPEIIKKLQEQLDKLEYKKIGAGLEQSASAVAAGLTSLQSLAGEGTKAYAQMKVAIDAANIAAAIGAIVNQGMGDPYTAFARIAAMAALMATFVKDVKSASTAGFANVAQQRQDSQGTGTVLGDANAKSESIAKATEITANATQQLVGLNRGMLTALQALQNALGAAGVKLARGAADVDFGRELSGPNGLQMTPIGSALESFFLGGTQKVVDQGIIIAGGTLQQMLNDIVVGAYQTVQTDGGLFGSDSTDEDVSDVSAAFSKQFQLVIKSIVDTVRAGATALGILPEDIEKALAAYRLEEIRISLKGLSAEDQQKELEAVFSSIFDGVAAAVVPFIEQFQQVGEGLGETLVRIATEVQVTQEAFKQLGIAISITDPEQVAQMSDALIQASGGIDEFISGLNSFVQNFSSDANQFAVNAEAIASAFEQVGLSVPATKEAMWALMQTLDPLTEEGQKQIATLLRLSEVSAAYYEKLDEFRKVLGIGGESDFTRELKSIRDSSVGLIKALQAAGASQQTLQHVYEASVAKINALIEQLKESARSLAFTLGLTTNGTLDQVSAEIARLQGIAGDGASAVQNFGQSIQDASQRAHDAIALLIGDLSPLNDRAKLEEARKGLMAGVVSQEEFLTIARRLFASSDQYKAEFAFAQRFPGTQSAGVDVGGSTAERLSAAQQARLAELLEVQRQLTAQQQLGQFQDLAKQIAQISFETGENLQEVLSDLGVTNIDDLVKGLGLSDEAALQAYIDAEKAKLEADGDNNATVVSVLRDILAALNAQNEARESLNEPGGGKPFNGGTAGGDDGSRTLTDGDVEAIGDAFGRALDRPGPDYRRNGRGSTMPA